MDTPPLSRRLLRVSKAHGLLQIEDDVHIDEVIRKNEKFGEGLHDNSEDGRSASNLEESTSSSGFDHHHLEHKAN
jgi:hypothetical protein